MNLFQLSTGLQSQPAVPPTGRLSQRLLPAVGVRMPRHQLAGIKTRVWVRAGAMMPCFVLTLNTHGCSH